MFALSEADFGRPILGCADGPAAFNARATARGSHVVSCDPLYHFDRAAIAARIAETRDVVLEQTRQHADAFVWDGAIGSVDELGVVRKAAMDAFLEDYDEGRRAGRYVDASLPELPFADPSFDLALCSHFLFLYSAQLDEAFHVAAARELIRVAGEVRIFPLVTLAGAGSPFVERCRHALEAAGLRTSIERVAYEFQRGANEMLRIRRA